MKCLPLTLVFTLGIFASANSANANPSIAVLTLVGYTKTSPPSPLLTKERGGFSRGEVESVLHLTDNRYNFSNLEQHNNNQADVLVTEPITINSNWNSAINQPNNPQSESKSIPLVREQGCKKVDPLDLIKDPGLIFQECKQTINEQAYQYDRQSEYYLKVPPLDSGLVNVTVTKF
ncbi:MAG: hypothetical protein QNJ47_21450 [Nostocaceae cyanobacterium]|nr:hypothetical protein [Nostocaceae cyanobacterium]